MQTLAVNTSSNFFIAVFISKRGSLNYTDHGRQLTVDKATYVSKIAKTFLQFNSGYP